MAQAQIRHGECEAHAPGLTGRSHVQTALRCATRACSELVMPVGGLNREDRRGYVTVMWESEGEVDSATNERTRELWTSRYACRDEPAQATLRETSIAP